MTRFGFWWNRFGPIFAAELRKKRTGRMRAVPGCRWHLDEVFVKINGERPYLWDGVTSGEVLAGLCLEEERLQGRFEIPQRLMSATRGRMRSSRIG